FGEWAARGALALGSRELRQLFSGFGYRLRNFQIDYAFAFALSGVTLGDTAGSHRFSLAYRFDPRSTSKKVLKAAGTVPIAPPVLDRPVAVLSVSTGSIQGLMPFMLDISSST